MILNFNNAKTLKEKRKNRAELFKKMYEYWRDFCITNGYVGYLPTDEQIKKMARRSIAQAMFDGRIDGMYRVKTA